MRAGEAAVGKGRGRGLAAGAVSYVFAEASPVPAAARRGLPPPVPPASTQGQRCGRDRGLRLRVARSQAHGRELQSPSEPALQAAPALAPSSAAWVNWRQDQPKRKQNKAHKAARV